jgi:hypothetical protein
MGVEQHSGVYGRLFCGSISGSKRYRGPEGTNGAERKKPQSFAAYLSTGKRLFFNIIKV